MLVLSVVPIEEELSPYCLSESSMGNLYLIQMVVHLLAVVQAGLNFNLDLYRHADWIVDLLNMVLVLAMIVLYMQKWQILLYLLQFDESKGQQPLKERPEQL